MLYKLSERCGFTIRVYYRLYGFKSCCEFYEVSLCEFIVPPIR